MQILRDTHELYFRTLNLNGSLDDGDFAHCQRNDHLTVHRRHIYQYHLDWLAFVACVLKFDDPPTSRVYASVRQGREPVSLVRVTIKTLVNS